MNPHTLIAARPHFRQVGNDLHFFLSGRVFRSLKTAEAATWNKLQEGAVLLKDLPDEAAVQSLVDSGLVEAIAPIPERDRRRVLVVEPHCDDAALSIGATMWKMRKDVEFHVITMASCSNYTTAFHMHRNYFDRAQITAMRTCEGALFAQHLGGHYYSASLAEATLRYCDDDWGLDFFNAHEVAIAISNNRRAPRTVLEAWIDVLRKFVNGRTFDEIWLPLGAGSHADHDLARNAALQVILDDRRHRIVRLYEDVPYGAQFQEHTDRILRVLAEGGAKLSPWSQDITADFPSKLTLLSIFASQFKVASILGGVERSAGAAFGGARVERLWTLEMPPDRLLGDEMWIGAPEVAQIRSELGKFRKGSSTARRVAIFAISAAGRWREDLGVLRNLFPKAQFVVYASPGACAEFRAVGDAREDVRCLDGRPSSWIKAAMREVPSSHRIIIAGDALKNANRLMALWPTGRKIACSQMDHLIQALADS